MDEETVSILKKYDLEDFQSKFEKLGVRKLRQFQHVKIPEDLDAMGMSQIDKNCFEKLIRELNENYSPAKTIFCKKEQMQLHTYSIYYILPMSSQRKLISGINPESFTIMDLVHNICEKERVSNSMTACLYTETGLPLTDDNFFNTWSLSERQIQNKSTIYAIFTPKENVNYDMPQTVCTNTQGTGSRTDDYEESTIHCSIMLKGVYSITVDLERDTLHDLRMKLSGSSRIPHHVINFDFQQIDTLENLGLIDGCTLHATLSSRKMTDIEFNDNFVSDMKPSVQQSNGGTCLFYSSLRVLVGKYGIREFGKVIGLIHHMTGFTPLALALHNLVNTRELSKAQMIAILEGLYQLFRKILPSQHASARSSNIIEDEAVFEHANICWASLIDDAKAEHALTEDYTVFSRKCALSEENLTEPVKLPGLPGTFEKRMVLQHIRDGKTIPCCTEKNLLPTHLKRATDVEMDLLCLGPSSLHDYVVYVVQTEHRTILDIPRRSLSDLNDQAEKIEELHIKPPLALKQLGLSAPAITWITKEKTGVYIQKQKMEPSKVEILDIESGKSKEYDIDALAYQLSNYQEETSSVHSVLARHPVEAIMVLFDNSSSMASESHWDKTMTRIDAIKQLFHAFANRSMAYDFHHIVGLTTFGNGVEVVGKFVDVLENFKDCVDSLKPLKNTRLYDALGKAVELLMDIHTEFPKCKLRILCLTDGQDVGSVTPVTSVLKKLIEENITVDSVIVGRDADRILHAISNATGGCCFQPKSIEEGLKMFEAETILSLEHRKKKPRIEAKKVTSMDHLKIEFKMRGYDDIPGTVLPDETNEAVVPPPKAIKIAQRKAILNHSGNAQRVLRIVQELKALNKAPHPFVHIFPCQDNIEFWKMLLQGPPQTPYQSGVFLLFIKFSPDYPVKPPEIRFITSIYHCNINSSGRVCHNILNRNYNAHTTIKNILDALYGLLSAPEPQDPLDSCLAEEYMTDCAKYNENARQFTATHASKPLEEWTKELIGEDDEELPPHLVCPLTKKLFVDPVITPYGHVYERKAIEEHLERNKTDPRSGKPLDISVLTPQNSMKALAEVHRKLQETIE